METPMGDTSNDLSSSNSMASTSTRTTSRGQQRKRQRSSWTEQHLITIFEKGVSRRRCSRCSITWSSNTSTGIIAKHLLDKHQINSTSQPHDSRLVIQPPLDSSKLLLTRSLERKIDSSVAKYIVTEMLPHVHVESLGFKQFMHDVLPGYEPKSARTLKRSILHMYVVLRQLMIDFLSMHDSRFAITFDGWSNSSLRSFYPMTLHWICRESTKPMSIILDFLNVFPGDGVGKRCGQALFTHLKSFGISSRLLAITCDGANDASVASKELGKLLCELHGFDVLPSSHMLRCTVHTFQLGVKSALDVISPSTVKLRNILVSIRSSKVRRAIFRKYSRSMCEHGEREPPSLDVITRWNSTLVMYQQAIKLRDVLSCTISDSAIAAEFADSILTIEDWNHIQAMEEWLRVPAIACNFLCGSKYPTLSAAGYAFTMLLKHCNKYMDMNVESLESLSAKATLEVQKCASERCLAYLIKYQESLKSIPSRIAMFLDRRVPSYNNQIEKDLDIFLESKYNVDVTNSTNEDECQETVHPEHMDFWQMLGVHESGQESSSIDSEIDQYLKYPRSISKEIPDPLQWWSNNRFALPRLYKMACDYLAIPASSVPSEEANSEAKHNFDDRIRLHSCTFKVEICIRSWLDVLQEANFPLPDDFNEAYNDLNIDLEDIAMEDDVVDYLLNDVKSEAKIP